MDGLKILVGLLLRLKDRPPQKILQCRFWRFRNMNYYQIRNLLTTYIQELFFRVAYYIHQSPINLD